MHENHNCHWHCPQCGERVTASKDANVAQFDCPQCGLFYMNIDTLEEVLVTKPCSSGAIRVIIACSIGLLLSYAGMAFATDPTEAAIVGYAAGAITVLLFGGDK